MSTSSFIPGEPPAQKGPLSRFLPPVYAGVAAKWLETISPEKWLLDPFGASPDFALEIARQGWNEVRPELTRLVEETVPAFAARLEAMGMRWTTGMGVPR